MAIIMSNDDEKRRLCQWYKNLLGKGVMFHNRHEEGRGRDRWPDERQIGLRLRARVIKINGEVQPWIRMRRIQQSSEGPESISTHRNGLKNKRGIRHGETACKSIGEMKYSDDYFETKISASLLCLLKTVS